MSAKATPPASFERHEHETGFTRILARLVEATPGAIGVVLVDGEGETVDYAGSSVDPFELKVAAAHFRIIVGEIDASKLPLHGGVTRRLTILGARRLFVIDCLPDGYALLSVLQHDAAQGHADRALGVTLRDLYREAGWSAPPGVLRWQEIDVRCGDADRPEAIKVDVGWAKVSVIGKVAAGLARGEVGFRVGIHGSAVEVTLVRGRDDRWYGDLPPDVFGTAKHD